MNQNRQTTEINGTGWEIIDESKCQTSWKFNILMCCVDHEERCTEYQWMIREISSSLTLTRVELGQIYQQGASSGRFWPNLNWIILLIDCISPPGTYLGFWVTKTKSIIQKIIIEIIRRINIELLKILLKPRVNRYMYQRTADQLLILFAFAWRIWKLRYFLTTSSQCKVRDKVESEIRVGECTVELGSWFVRKMINNSNIWQVTTSHIKQPLPGSMIEVWS